MLKEKIIVSLYPDVKGYITLAAFPYVDAIGTSTYKDAAVDGRLFDRPIAALKYVRLFGGSICALIDVTLNEFDENERYVREFIVV